MADVRTLTSGLKDRLPGPALEAARSGAELWGTSTSSARMLPSFLIIGAQRCGTTTLYRLLSDHPALARPTASKGIGYFDLRYERGMRWYRGHFPLRSLAERRTPEGVEPQTFESSGYYSFHPLAAERIAADLPGTRLVMVLRDPVERAHSAYKHESARGFELESFERALELEPQRLDGEVERLVNEPGYQSFHHRHHAYVGRGQYAEQVARIRRAVGDDHLYVMDADDFFADPQQEFLALTDWLGLPRWRPAAVPHSNPRPGSAMDDVLRSRLEEHFEPHDRHLAELIGRVPSWRRELSG